MASRQPRQDLVDSSSARNVSAKGNREKARAESPNVRAAAVKKIMSTTPTSCASMLMHARIACARSHSGEGDRARGKIT